MPHPSRLPYGQQPTHTSFNAEEKLIINAAMTKTGLRSLNEVVRVAVGLFCDSILEGDSIPYETNLFYEGLSPRDKFAWGCTLQTPMSIETPSRGATVDALRLLSEADSDMIQAILAELAKEG